MPKKSVNTKAEEARQRKAEASAVKQAKEDKDKEDSYWKENEGPKSKASMKREEEAAKRAEAQAKRAEKKRLEDLEAMEMDTYGKKADKKAQRVSVPKVTAAELAQKKDVDKKKLEEQAEQSSKKDKKIVDEGEYERMVAVENINRMDDVIEARSVESAIAQLAVAEELPVDKHPEKRLGAAQKAFEEAELPKLRAEKPGLTLRQYKDLLWKMWKKAPENPMNQQ